MQCEFGKSSGVALLTQVSLVQARLIRFASKLPGIFPLRAKLCGLVAAEAAPLA